MPIPRNEVCVNQKLNELTVVVDDLEDVGAAGLVLRIGLQEEYQGEVVVA